MLSMRTNKLCGWQTCAVASSAGAFRTPHVTRTLPSPSYSAALGCQLSRGGNKVRERILGTSAAVARSRKLDPTPARKHTPLDERVHCRRLRNAEAEVHIHFLDWAEASMRSAEYPGSELQDIQSCGPREGGLPADAKTARAEGGICSGTLLYRARSEDAPARDRPFEIGHIDHTELDVEVISGHTGQVLGRPWMTLLIDAFSRRVLAFHVTFDAPSYRSCMMILRECVCRHRRLPQIVVLEGGREFDSVYFETLLARYECTKKTRPPAKARFDRCASASSGSRTRASFISRWEYPDYAQRPPSDQVGQSEGARKLAVARAVRLFGGVFLRGLRYDRAPCAWAGAARCLPTWRGGDWSPPASANCRRFGISDVDAADHREGNGQVAPGRGVKINHVYYWAESLRVPTIEHKPGRSAV